MIVQNNVDTVGAAVEFVLLNAALGAIALSIVDRFIVDQPFNPGLEGSLLLYRGALLLSQHGLEVVGTT